jgi:hypothetical protein
VLQQQQNQPPAHSINNSYRINSYNSSVKATVSSAAASFEDTTVKTAKTTAKLKKFFHLNLI